MKKLDALQKDIWSLSQMISVVITDFKERALAFNKEHYDSDKMVIATQAIEEMWTFTLELPEKITAIKSLMNDIDEDIDIIKSTMNTVLDSIAEFKENLKAKVEEFQTAKYEYLRLEVAPELFIELLSFNSKINQKMMVLAETAKTLTLKAEAH